jgi:DNA-binding beta-propeller fold protein YncE
MVFRIGTVMLSAIVLAVVPAGAGYVNFESSHVNPIALTPSGDRLLAVNTPDALLEVFTVGPGGVLTHAAAVPVGLEPVTVVARSDTEAWVVNHLSDTVSVVDLAQGVTTRTLTVTDEPTDVAFANGRAFVSVAQDDAVLAFDLANLDAAPTKIDLFGRKPRALAVSNDGSRVWAVVLLSGNQTTVVSEGVIFNNDANLSTSRLTELGLNQITCNGTPPPYPPLPVGITRNPDLTDPPSVPQYVHPEVSLIVKWNEAVGRWEDETGADWNHCLPFRLPDHDLFGIDTTTLAVTEVDHLGTILFDVSVNPANGKVYVPNTEARNAVRFEHPLGVQGHTVDNRLSIVDPGNGNALTVVDLNTHVDRDADPTINLAERLASVSQPGMMVWTADGSTAYLTAIGSRKVFRVDGACTSGNCIFGADRAVPDAVEVGEGPTGVALLESDNRLYVLNRFSNSIAVVEASSLTKLDEIALHDPSSETIKTGRRLLYDGIISSRNGDQSCASCHVSGDRDGLAWDLGDPEGEFAPYSTASDNVRFIVPLGGVPVECDPAICAAHDGFDPQKGPMTTQTFRGMLEPLHWRGDRPTMNDFNPAFVGLLGAADAGPINGKSAGLSEADMELFRQFALGIRFPPNPLRNVDDTLPNIEVTVPGTPFKGNPAAGETLFNSGTTDAGQACVACHAHPFGAAGGTLGGVAPSEPTSPGASALFNGDADQVPHSDMKVAHMRNMYEKWGPRFGDHVGAPPEAKSGFGYTHAGAIPDLGTFFSFNVFTVTAQQVRDVSAFSTHFPTGTKPSVGRTVTVPAGTPPTGSTEEESLLTTLTALGDLASPGRHCELTVTAPMDGRIRAFHLSGGVWVGDLSAEPAKTTLELREQATGPISFLCGTLDSGTRLGGDRDEDSFLNGDDCAAGDPGSWGDPIEIGDLMLDKIGGTHLAWSGQDVLTGPGVRYEVAGGSLSDLSGSGLVAATSCIAGDLDSPSYTDVNADPAPGEGLFYLARASNACGNGGWGQNREALDPLTCP